MIVRKVFRALTTVKVNVEELSMKVYSTPDSGGIIFKAIARLTQGSQVDIEDI